MLPHVAAHASSLWLHARQVLALAMDIPPFLSHLKRFAGMPIPVTAKWFDGKPDLRTVDREEVLRCVERGLCGVCGRRMIDWCFFIGGERSRESHLFTDPAMHVKCARYSATHCPYLTGERRDFSQRPLPAGGINEIVVVNENVAPGRPDKMLILRARVKDTRLVTVHGEMAVAAGIDGDLVIQAGHWYGVEEILDVGKKS